ncbi:MAG: LicD family protein [Treponema sp.]|nr:LicD family protein [Treponema sp.]
MTWNFEIKDAQERLFTMAKKIASILEINDIPYEIAFGTLLGAIRHKGFIPWDDDFDFFLFDDTYDSAIEILRHNLPQNMFLEDKKSEPNYFHAWARVKDMNSECDYCHYPHDGFYAHKGLSVDLYRIKKIKTSDFAEFRYLSAIKYIERRKELKLITDEDYKSRKASYEIRKNNDKVDTTDEEIFAYPFDIGFQLVNDVLPLKKYKFEDSEFWGPANGESILSFRYGNWQSLPPENQRIPHYSTVIFK